MNSHDFRFGFSDEVKWKEFESNLKELPDGWRVLQIHAISAEKVIPDLLVVRFEKGKKPLMLKIVANPQKVF